MTSAPASGQPFAGDRPQGERVAPGPGLTREAARFPTRRVCGGEGGRRPSTRCGPSVRSIRGGGSAVRGRRLWRGPGVQLGRPAFLEAVSVRAARRPRPSGSSGRCGAPGSHAGASLPRPRRSSCPQRRVSGAAPRCGRTCGPGGAPDGLDII
ncbi:translation initiation factor IF-2-like isoform X1 [Canis lupus dingo]|uniref:translation initiation factor IF-2-like isoform X1 n=1 Tax=Canis lupus dingo TaxID=286419 RepID=UPI0020C57E96|nr:translation initiation factor IF-2-like isoform X1 [Canis lupus dingo]